MHIKKLDENSIRIVLSTEDLIKNNINLHSFMSNSLESQDFFTYILDKAEVEFGFNTDNSKLIIEAIATENGYFVFTITKFNIADKKNIKVKNIESKHYAPNYSLSICEFQTFDDFCDFCKNININLKSILSKLKNSSLYLYNNKYYLILNLLNLNIKNFQNFCYTATEFANFINNVSKFEQKLKASGQIIMQNHAISTCLKYF